MFFSSHSACPLAVSAGSSNNTAASNSAQLARVNTAVNAAAAANLLAARRGSYPLNAVAALTAAQQRNLAAMAGSPTTTSTGLTSTMVSASNACPAVSQATGQGHAANSLTAVAAAAAAQQQLHGLTP